MFDSAYSLWEEEKYDEAVQHYIALTKAFPNSNLVDDSLFWIGNIYEHYLKEPEQAIRFYRSLNKRYENSEYYIPSMKSLARVYSERNDEDKRRAVLIYQKLQKIFDKAEQWDKNQYDLAEVFFHLKEYNRCRIELKKLINKNPDSKLLSQAFYLIGYSFYLEGKLNLAKVAFIETEKTFQDSSKILDSMPAAMSLADVFEELGELQSAIQVYRKILEALGKKNILANVYRLKIAKLKDRLKKTSNQDYDG